MLNLLGRPVLRVLSITPEFFPLIKTGGLGDVAGALPRAVAEFGVDMRTLLPAYPAVRERAGTGRIVAELADPAGRPTRLIEVASPALGHLYLLEAPHLYDRPGNPYLDLGREDWPDNPQRFAALAWAGAAIGLGLVPDWQPEIVHGHDWQAGLAPAYLAFAGRPRPRTVTTVHNLAFQGQCSARLLAELRLPAYAFSIQGCEYYGSIGFLKAGLFYADRLTTVSPSYAQEIQTDAGGMGMAGLFRTRAAVLEGILNGIDEAIWDPARDPHLARPYDAETLANKLANKRLLQERFGLERREEAFLCCVVSRLRYQKGLDLLLEVLDEFLAGGGQLALLGAGEAELEAGFAAAASTHPGQVGCLFDYNEELAHLMQGGGDAILVPSRYEPCGLTQLYGLRYGTAPIVARIGGLADTVVDANAAALEAGIATGFQFAPVTAEALRFALRRAARLFVDKEAWQRLQRAAMAYPVGWRRPARAYAALYGSLVGACSEQ